MISHNRANWAVWVPADFIRQFYTLKSLLDDIRKPEKWKKKYILYKFGDLQNGLVADPWPNSGRHQSNPNPGVPLS
jgi:hypothetical protein